jgi:hypothetical protein
MRTKTSYYTMCPECESRISISLAAKLQATRIGTSCICSQCNYDWICIQEWILSEGSNSSIGMTQPLGSSSSQAPAPHFQQQATPQHQAFYANSQGQPGAPHLPTFQPTSLMQQPQQLPSNQSPQYREPFSQGGLVNGQSTPQGATSEINQRSSFMDQQLPNEPPAQTPQYGSANHIDGAHSNDGQPNAGTVPVPHWMNQQASTRQQTPASDQYDRER